MIRLQNVRTEDKELMYVDEHITDSSAVNTYIVYVNDEPN